MRRATCARTNFIFFTQSVARIQFREYGDPCSFLYFLRDYLTLRYHLARQTHNQDFANPHIIGNNQIVQTGNTINNIEDVYPNAQFVEFHFTGFDPQYTGMDWTSLRIVMEEYNSQLYIIGIIHDEWTI